jgi:hypothetical protein
MDPFAVCDAEVPVAFAFLVAEFGFAEPSVVGEPVARYGFVYRVYRNATTAVQVGYNAEFNALDVFIGHRVADRVPSAGDPDQGTYLQSLLRAKLPALFDQLAGAKGLHDEIRLAASLLKQEAADLLRGDFRLLDTALVLQKEISAKKKVEWEARLARDAAEKRARDLARYDPRHPVRRVYYTTERILRFQKERGVDDVLRPEQVAPCSLCARTVWIPERVEHLATGGLLPICKHCFRAHRAEPWVFEGQWENVDYLRTLSAGALRIVEDGQALPPAVAALLPQLQTGVNSWRDDDASGIFEGGQSVRWSIVEHPLGRLREAPGGAELVACGSVDRVVATIRLPRERLLAWIKGNRLDLANLFPSRLEVLVDSAQ